MTDVAGRVAVITGGGSGIGQALAHALGRAGASVVVADVRAEAMQATVDALHAGGVTAVGATVDVRDDEAVDELARGVADHFGRVDIVCNNAGISIPGRAWELTFEQWRDVIDVCLWGVVNGVRSFVPRILDGGRGGHVVNVASMAGMLHSPGVAPYAAAKHGVVGLSKALRGELANKGVGVTVVCPGMVQTSITEHMREYAHATGASERQLASIDRTAAGVAELGIPAEQAADLVLRAVEGDVFWALPNGEAHLDSVTADHEELLRDALRR